MTDKQIIIDGVDVSGCGYYDPNADKESHFLHDCKKEHAPCWSCASMPSCLYKKYKRKEQECEELKRQRTVYIKEAEENFEVHTTLKDNYRKLYQTLTEIKEIAEHCINQDICTFCDYSDKCYIEDEEIPTYDVCKLILQKISECEGNQ